MEANIPSGSKRMRGNPMKQLSLSRKKKLLAALKQYRKKYLLGKYKEGREASTRVMIDAFLADVLNFVALDEIKLECTIKGTRADYVIQIKGKEYFIVETKGMSVKLSARHLRQAVDYAAYASIDWVLLTNGRQFDFYKVFEKPLEARQVFSFDLCNKEILKPAVDCFQYMTRTLVLQRGLESLWDKVSALDPVNFSRLLFAKAIIKNLRRQLKKFCRYRFQDDDIVGAISRVIAEKVDNVKPVKRRKRHRSRPSLLQKTINVNEPALNTVQPGPEYRIS